MAAGDLVPQKAATGTGTLGAAAAASASGLDPVDDAAGGGGGVPDALPTEQYVSLTHDFQPPLEPYQPGTGIAVLIGAPARLLRQRPPGQFATPMGPRSRGA